MEVLKKLILFPLTATLIILSCTGCYEEFNLKPEGEPKLCLYSCATAGQPLSAFVAVSHIWGTEKISQKEVIDTDVKLYVNDSFIETLTYDGSHSDSEYYLAFRAKYIPKERDRIRIVALNKKYGETSGETTVSNYVHISDIKCEVMDFTKLPHTTPGIVSDKVYDYSNCIFCDVTLSITIEFEDPANEVNFYKLGHKHDLYDEKGGIISTLDPSASQESKDYWRKYWTVASTSCKDPIFSEYIDPIDKLFAEGENSTADGGINLDIFSDNTISGQRRSMEIKWVCSRYPLPLDETNPYKVKISLSSISKEVFEGELSLWNLRNSYKKDLAKIGLGNYIWVASNVSSNGGYVGSSADDYILVDIYGEILKYYNSQYTKTP